MLRVRKLRRPPVGRFGFVSASPADASAAFKSCQTLGRSRIAGPDGADACGRGLRSGTTDRAFYSLASNHLEALAVSQDGRLLLTGAGDGRALLWDIANGREIRHFKGHDNPVTAIAFSTDSRLLLTGSRNELTAHLWEVESGRDAGRFEGHCGGLNAVAFSPDGKLALTGSDDKTARLWEVASGREVRCFKGHANGVSAVAFSSDGQMALTGSDGPTALLWEVASGREVQRFAWHPNTQGLEWFDWYDHKIKTVAFLPDQRHALTGSNDGTVRQWDLADGREVRRLKGYGERVTAITFSPTEAWCWQVRCIIRRNGRATRLRICGRWRVDARSGD